MKVPLGAAKEERFRRLVAAAARQSRKRTLPKLHFVKGISEAIKLSGELMTSGSEQKFNLVTCSLDPDAQPASKLSLKPGPVSIVIGPEGDLSPDEEKSLATNSSTLLNLGPEVLRSETAAICSVVSIQACFGHTL